MINSVVPTLGKLNTKKDSILLKNRIVVPGQTDYPHIFAWVEMRLVNDKSILMKNIV
jgi:hypothetical protein